MILGILSDTHGRAHLAERGVAVLREAGAQTLVHCGDVGSEDVLAHLAGLPAAFVWGNSDDPGPTLESYARSLGLTAPTDVPLRLQFNGKRLAVFHGHEPEFRRIVSLAEAQDFDALATRADADYLLFGHTHAPFDERFGSVRAINPGALHRAPVRTVATLNLETDELQYWRVSDDGAPRLEKMRPA